MGIRELIACCVIKLVRDVASDQCLSLVFVVFSEFLFKTGGVECLRLSIPFKRPIKSQKRRDVGGSRASVRD